MIDCFDATVAREPGKTALVDSSKEITFEELDLESRIIASKIVELLPEDVQKPVAVFMPKCIEVAVADIAIMRSANAFMNLDVKVPLDRLSNILNQIEPILIVTLGKQCEIISAIAGTTPVLVIDECLSNGEISEQCMDVCRNRLSRQIDTDPVCIINTSGSTGTPKGVVLGQRGFFDFLDWACDTFGFDGSEVIGGLSPVVFDIYDHELFLMMTKGSTIIMLDGGLAAFPAKLLTILESRKVTYIFWVPSIMVTIANMDLLSKVDLSCLKTIWFAGEVFPTKQFNYWRKSLPDATFANLYGPIEITLDCTYYIAEHELPEDRPLPIGRPCRNTDVLILDDDDKPCAAGEKGELCVRGSSLALGYYNNAEKTAASFTQNPLQKAYPELIYRTGDIVYVDDVGLICFTGRKDSLVKHHGYRIELGEIEHVIVNTLKIFQYCCVVYDFSVKEIVLFYESDCDMPISTFRRELAKEFPAYMIPGRLVRMEELPRNNNGKIDRLALKTVVEKGL